MPEQKCPRCGGPVKILVDEYFDWDCPACQLAVRIKDKGKVSASSPMRDGKRWTEEPWVMPFFDSIVAKKD